jgi:hypothetical protein
MSDYLQNVSSSNNIIEEFKSSGAVNSTGGFAGSGAFGGSRGSSSRSPSTISQGGSRKYGSAGYAKVNPFNGVMSGLANVQPNSYTGLGTPNSVKISNSGGSFTGGSFGGDGKYVVGFPGIRPGSSLPASSSPSLYMKPKITYPHPKLEVGKIPDVVKKYGHIDKNILNGIPGPVFGYKYDNVNKNRSDKILGPKIPPFYSPTNKNLNGLYNYSGYGYYLDPFYWGLGPFYPNNGIYVDYPDIPFDYSELMNKQIDADNMINTIQDQLATQYNEQVNSTPYEDINYLDPEQLINQKENFTALENYNSQTNIVIVLIVILMLYILFSISLSDLEKSINFF